MRAKAKLERDRLERGQADELAGAMNEFFAALYTEDPDALPVHDMSYTSSFTDLPLSSPDSITVTTEFGVLEETGNVTIISAGGATHPYDTPDNAEYYDDLEYHHLHSQDEGPESYVVMTEDTSLPPAPGPSDWVTAVALQHHQTQNAWLLQQQMQSMYHIHPSASGSGSGSINVHSNANSNVAVGSPPPPQHTALAGQHQEGDTGGSSDELDVDGGDDADVDTDELLDDDDEDAAAAAAAPHDHDHDQGAATPTPGIPPAQLN